jgi:hypothetical protein
VADASDGIALSAPGGAFGRDQREDDKQQHRRKLRRPRQIGPRQPGLVDRECQSLNSEKFHCADVVDGFHQRQADTDGDGWPRQGRAMRKNSRGGAAPSVRDTSMMRADCVRNSTRVAM